MPPNPFAAAALDLLYPPTCLVCEEATAQPHGLCASCWRDTPFLSGRLCACCGAPALEDGDAGADWTVPRCGQCALAAPVWRYGRAAARYDGAARRLTLQLKHADRTAAARPMAAWMARAGAALLRPDATGAPPLLIPTPLHWRRRLTRRYNQAAELARRLSRESGAPWTADALRRARATPSQDGLDRAQRQANIAGAFAVTRGWTQALRGRRVLLVDDVMTTGATLGAAARALLDAGAGPIDALVFARVAREEFDSGRWLRDD